VIKLISGIDLADANRAMFQGGEPLQFIQHGLLASVAVASWAVARRIGFPSAMLLVPLLSSAALHGTGVITVHVPSVFSVLAQVVIGASVGAWFIGYTMGQILRDGWLAAVVGGVLALGALGMALLIAPLAHAAPSALFLAYLPGGAPELGVVALALRIDPAMVAAHHVLRVFLIVALLPFAARWISRHDNSPP